MKRLVALLCAVAACREPAPPEAPAPAPPAQAKAPLPPAELASLFWSSVADTGSGKIAKVRQTATSRQECQVSASLGDQKVWSAQACLATQMQLRFVSPDAVALLVLEPLPDSDELSLGALYRDGKRASELTPASLRLPPRASRIDAGKLHWLGPRDQRARPEGVEVQLLDGSLLLIRFDGKGLATPPPSAPATAAGVLSETGTCNPCAYTDADGTYHLVESWSEIPPRYRSAGGRIQGQIQRADARPPGARDFAQEPPPTPRGPSDFDRRAAQPPPPKPAPDVPRNELGEDFIQYTNRIAGRR